MKSLFNISSNAVSTYGHETAAAKLRQFTPWVVASMLTVFGGREARSCEGGGSETDLATESPSRNRLGKRRVCLRL